MSSKITHPGVVESMENDCMKVRIMQTSACSGCKIAAHCSASEQKEKLVDVVLPAHHADYHVGDHVVVAASLRTGIQAVVYGFGLSLIVLIVTLITVLQATGNEGLAALSGLAALIPYYLIVYLMRHRLKKKFAFTIDDA